METRTNYSVHCPFGLFFFKFPNLCLHADCSWESESAVPNIRYTMWLCSLVSVCTSHMASNAGGSWGLGCRKLSGISVCTYTQPEAKSQRPTFSIPVGHQTFLSHDRGIKGLGWRVFNLRSMGVIRAEAKHFCCPLHEIYNLSPHPMCFTTLL